MTRVAMLQKSMTLWVVVCIPHILTVGFKEIVEVLSAFGSDVCAKEFFKSAINIKLQKFLR